MLGRLALRNSAGLTMPQMGFGTWKSQPGETKRAVEVAIKNGYRMIDAANDYNNEPEVGEAIKTMITDGVVKREDLFVQTKLWNTNHRPEHVKPDLMQSLKDLQLDYVDSFVIHWPQACPSAGDRPTLRTTGACTGHYSKGVMFPLNDEGYFMSDKESHYVETWKAMESLVDEGLVKTIGLSNFNRSQIAEVLSIPGIKYKPCVLQNECHPYLQQRDLIDFCRIHGIVFQAFSSLGSGNTHLAVHESPSGVIPLQDPLIKKLSEKHGKSPAQIILRWHFQRGISFVSKSVTPERIVANQQITDFELSDEEMQSFSGINYSWRHLLWRETSHHPDYPFKDELPYNYVLEKAPTITSSGN
eukprot:Hpha_TRINITY_DN8709_c0_g1::TRINITY_DN8709_c0_g1_i1::g.45145::m.45145